MSLPGDRHPIPRVDVRAAVPGGQVSEGEGERRATLPIRLSVTQGGLGIELSQPLSLGVAQIRVLEVSLLAIRYPVDLSKGVKQFRHRRSRLARAVVAIDLLEAARLWSERIGEIWGEPASVSIRPVPTFGDGQIAENVQSGVEALAVTVSSRNAALAFDLVVASGTAPCFVVDAPRSWGSLPAVSDLSPLRLALRVLETLPGTAAGPRVVRVGRVLRLNDLAEALALSILPQLGCRLPEVANQVIVGLGCEGGQLSVELGASGEPFAATRRAMRVFAASQLTQSADDLLARGDTVDARKAYLDALQAAPGHPDVLLELADLDLVEGRRAESAISFLEEVDASASELSSRASSVRKHVAWSRALQRTGRHEAALEALRRAGERETEGVLAAFFHYELSCRENDDRERRRWLDEALGRAPFLSRAREARLGVCLASGDEKTAQADAEHLEAAQRDDDGRANVCLFVGSAYLDAGRQERARDWFRRALRFRPDDPRIKIRLAQGMSSCSSYLRAAELLSSALLDIETQLSGLSASELREVGPFESLHENKALAHLELAKALLLGDQNAPAALSQLAMVPIRSSSGKEARLLEARLHQEAKRPEARDRVLFRLLEAVEMRWISSEGLFGEMKRYLVPDADQGLLDFARRVLDVPS